MKKLIYSIALISVAFGCKSPQTINKTTTDRTVVNLDLLNIKDDKVKVTVDPEKFTTQVVTFHIPKTVPGTYSINNYGRLIENFKAIDYLGAELLVVKTDDNTWKIENASNLDKITYLVNDSFDIDGEKGVFSPAGTNIERDANILLNLHGFVGYFDGLKEKPYQLIINRPNTLYGSTSLKLAENVDLEKTPNSKKDIYLAQRYFDVVDNPIMYSRPDTTYVNVEGIKVLISVYSPNKVHNAKSIKPQIETMIAAQKRFLGKIDNTANYSILLYLADPAKLDAKGFGALEHHSSTVVILPETMPLETLNGAMKDVVSHEFFHILTPLNVHAEEIHYFDYNAPKMSQHLWMYEGVTEYFANLFQVNQDLIANQGFYKRISSQIEASKNYNDSLSFTYMSKNVLEEPYKDEYYNVYQKGALIGMALDLRLRELSKGEMGVLDLMKKLSEKYGKNTPFKDDQLIPTIVSLTYPEIKTFFDTYITGSTPIPYDQFLANVGVALATEETPTSYFLNGQVPYIDGNPENMELFFRKGITLNSFLKELGVKNGDVIKEVNGTAYTIQNVYDLVMESQSWTEGDEVSMRLERNDEEIMLSGKITLPTTKKTTIKEMDLPATDARVKLRTAWLKN
ncbi:putative metalloprotease with PDZ domain [Gillisia sp. Hel_I_86]|uniref:M61 family metallopeptidase n=1 Tax=Gillisia sp. Hel_I_86 TaxID=1249981 RepID=UPI00119BA8F0|nr:peptidase M61 [Gillisia sp. Hel_I_86]TVZ28336.1 putative metalloprotease with PDZ domain [Gillisia sp. Hel_I_86]